MVVNGQTSETLPVLSGVPVPQGSVIAWAPAIPHIHRWGDEFSPLRGKPTNCICRSHTAVQTNHMPGRLLCTARGHGLLD